VINFVLELGIWLPALKHRRLAENGLPVLATIDSLDVFKGSKRCSYKAKVTYEYEQKSFTQTLALSKSEYDGLSRDTTEVMLCNQAAPEDIVLYKYCRYHAIGTQT